MVGLWLLSGQVPLKSQTVTGTLQGTVTDANGALVPGADITVNNTQTGQRRHVQTNSDGFYVVTFLPLGHYDIVVAFKGFNARTQTGLEVTLNHTRVVDFVLKPAGLSESVVIIDSAQINSTNAEIKGVLNAQEILDKPTFNQSNYLTLAETFTGFQENPTQAQNAVVSSSGSSINFNGTGTRGATFQIDGVNNDDSSEHQQRQGASLSTIKEFQVITNNFTAEFGRGYGAVVLVQTKSGTNSIHGDVYLYHNDSGLNATNNEFTPGTEKPVNRRNQYGFDSGFPLISNKLFAFLSYDNIHDSGADNFTRDVFLPTERNPNNWFLTTSANDTASNRTFIQSVIDRFPPELIPNDPRSPRTFTGPSGFYRPRREYSGRLDWNPRVSDNIMARWQYTRQLSDDEEVIIGEALNQNHKQQNIGVSWTHSFTANTVGEFRYGLGLRTTLVGIKAGDRTPVIRFRASPVASSIIGRDPTFPINRWQTDHQFVYNFSTLVGSNHLLKIGTDIRRQQLDDFADNFSRGFYDIAATCNGINYGTSYNALLNGCATTFQKGYGPFFLENRLAESNFYAEDNWRVLPNLTLNLGLRYELVFAPHEIKGRMDYGFCNDTDNLEPRVGFAWTPRFSSGFFRQLLGRGSNSVVRGGYGIYHGRIYQSVFSLAGATVRANPPNALFYNETGTARANFSPVNLLDPTNGFVFVPGPQTQRHSEAHIDPGLEMPYTQQWSLTIEREFPFRSKLRASYVGNRGIGLIKYTLENLPETGDVLVTDHPNNAPAALYVLSGLPPNDPRRADVRGQNLRVAQDAQCAGTLTVQGIAATAQCPLPVPIGNFEYSFRLPRTNERRPDGRYTTNTLVSNNAWTYYHGLQVDWIRRLSSGLTFQVAYTWSKAIDTHSESFNLGARRSSGGDTNNTGNQAAVSRGLSHFDTRSRLTIFGTYTLPFWRNSKAFFDDKGLTPGSLLRGWTLSSVITLSRGTPFTVSNNDGYGDLNFDGFVELRPALVDPSVLGRRVTDPHNAMRQIPASAFRTPNVQDFGCCLLGRNTFFGDGVENVDVGIYRTFRLPFENHQVIVRADLFNAFNHVQFAFPNSDLASPTFGQIIQTATQYSPRVVQLSIRYQF